MATVNNKAMVDTIIEGDGIYPGDEHMRVVKIVEYTNDWGGTCWGLIYRGEDLMRYHTSGYTHNPKTIWVYNPGFSERI